MYQFVRANSEESKKVSKICLNDVLQSHSGEL